MFTTYYFTDYNEAMYRIWFGGFQETLDQAMQYKGAMIHMTDIIYPNALLQMEVPPSKLEMDKYRQDGEFRFEYIPEEEFESFEYYPGDVYICRDDNEWMADFFKRNGMETQQYGTFILGYTSD
ncbi:MAG: hypothetical protein IJ600_06055 [Lachnospiraceae bacterium]|nr:hypothetical protein [Lachnospiraceae bacterium]